MKMVALGEVLQEIRTGPFGSLLHKSDYVLDGIPLVNPMHIMDGRIKSDRASSITEEKAEALTGYMLKAGDIVMGRRGDMGRCAVVRAEDGPLLCGTGSMILSPNPKRLDPDYAAHLLRTPMARKFFENEASGVTMLNLNPSAAAKLVLPLPPLEEQRRIAAILDAADALRAKRRAAHAKLDTLAQSIFVEMFGDPVENSKNWPDGVTLGDIAEIASGITKGRKLRDQSTRCVPYLAVVNVQDRHLVLDPLKEIEATESEIARYRLRSGDLLLTEGGDPDKLGRGTLWNGEIDECIHQNHIFRVRLRDKKLHPLFLNWLVGSSRGKTYFLKSAKQTTGIASINMTQLRAFPLLVPPMAIQKEFARRMTSLKIHSDLLSDSCGLMNDLFASIQHRAFRGELTAADEKVAAA